MLFREMTMTEYTSRGDCRREYPKAGEPVKHQAYPSKVHIPARLTSQKTGFSVVDGDFHLFRLVRKGKMRRPAWFLTGVFNPDGGRFRSKQASRNYRFSLADIDPVDLPLVDRAFDLHSIHTQKYRRAAKCNQLRAYGKAQDKAASWLDDMLGFDEDCCLFFPGAKAGQPVKVKYNYGSMTAARAMLLKTQGLPEGEANFAIHKCGMGHMSCVNPRHLAWGTAADNARDREIHNAKTVDLSSCCDEAIGAVKKDSRLTRVIAWDLRIPLPVVSAIKSEKIYPTL